jgi:uncharacterized protein
MATHEGLHEEKSELRTETIDCHRALASLGEELEAVDWYAQRIDATADPELRAILTHNRDEEKEHAAMALEWLRRRDPKFQEVLKTYLFTTGSIIGQEAIAEKAKAGGPAGVPGDGALGIGSLKGS